MAVWHNSKTLKQKSKTCLRARKCSVSGQNKQFWKLEPLQIDVWREKAFPKTKAGTVF